VSAEQVELAEAGDATQVTVALAPDLLEVGLAAGVHAEAVHRDVHPILPAHPACAASRSKSVASTSATPCASAAASANAVGEPSAREASPRRSEIAVQPSAARVASAGASSGTSFGSSARAHARKPAYRRRKFPPPLPNFSRQRALKLATQRAS